MLIYFLGALDNQAHPTKHRFYYTFVKDLAEIFKRKLQISINQYQATREQKIHKDKEIGKLASVAVDNNLVLSKRILINPKPSLLNGLNSAFVIKHLREESEVYWYDNLGTCNPVDLKLYKEFKEYLTNKIHLQERDLPEIKPLIEKVVLPKAKGIGEALKALEHFFTENGEEVITTFDLLVDPLSSEFIKLQSTFVLKSLLNNKFELS